VDHAKTPNGHENIISAADMEAMISALQSKFATAVHEENSLVRHSEHESSADGRCNYANLREMNASRDLLWARIEALDKCVVDRTRQAAIILGAGAGMNTQHEGDLNLSPEAKECVWGVLEELHVVEQAMAKVANAVVLNARDATLLQRADPVGDAETDHLAASNNRLLLAAVKELHAKRACARSKLRLLNKVLDVNGAGDAQLSFGTQATSPDIRSFLDGISDGSPTSDYASPFANDSSGNASDGAVHVARAVCENTEHLDQFLAGIQDTTPPNEAQNAGAATSTADSLSLARGELAEVRRQLAEATSTPASLEPEPEAARESATTYKAHVHAYVVVQPKSVTAAVAEQDGHGGSPQLAASPGRRVVSRASIVSPAAAAASRISSGSPPPAATRASTAAVASQPQPVPPKSPYQALRQAHLERAASESPHRASTAAPPALDEQTLRRLKMTREFTKLRAEIVAGPVGAQDRPQSRSRNRGRRNSIGDCSPVLRADIAAVTAAAGTGEGASRGAIDTQLCELAVVNRLCALPRPALQLHGGASPAQSVSGCSQTAFGELSAVGSVRPACPGAFKRHWRFPQ
jgi:hypothetical protein